MRFLRIHGLAAAFLALFSFSPVTTVAQTALAPVALVPGATAVGTAAPALTVTLTLKATRTSAAPVAVTQGVDDGEFTLASGGPVACTAGQMYLAGQQCSLAVVFRPKFPGLRSGAVTLRGTDGTLLGSVLVSGYATGPLAVLTQGTIETVAGTTEFIFRGDGGPATASPIFLPTSVVTDSLGNLYISDSGNNRIRRVDAASGLISTFAGTIAGGYNGDSLLATQASLGNPGQLAIDGAGNLYITDNGNQVVRRVDAASGLITTVAGTPGRSGYAGDGASATSALLSSPQGIALDAAGNLYIADTGNSVVRRVDATTGLITTVAGTGSAGFDDDGAATAHKLNSPWNLAFGPDGALYIADQNNHRIRTLKAGILTTVAGFSQRGFAGDNGPATSASLNFPEAMTLDPAGNLYIADTGDNVIRFVNATTGIITTLSGIGSQTFSGDGDSAASAGIYGPDAVHFDASGNLYIADLFHNRIRRVDAAALKLKLSTQKVGKASPTQNVPFLNAGNAPLTATPPGLSQAALDPAATTCQPGVALPPSGLCTLGAVFLPTTVGSAIDGTITVTSDAQNTAPVITLEADVLSVNPTSIALVSSLNPSLIGQAVTFTATVASDDTGRTGTVVFSDNGVKLCTSALTAAGTATCTPPALSLGSHPITAVYSGDTNNAAAASSPLVQVVKQQPALALTAAPNPAVVTQAVALSVTVTSPTGTPTGTVTFYDGTTALGSAALSNGSATFSTSALAAGTHPLLVHYVGDASNAAADSNTVSEVIQLAATSTVLISSATSAAAGTAFTFTAAVSTTSGPAPTGSVTFFDGAASLGTVPLTGTSANFSSSTLSPGPHSITAAYSGDASDATSTSAAQLVTVSQVSTSTLLATDANPVSAGAALHITATVTSASSTGGPVTGTVTFADGSVSLGTATLDASGHAAFSLSTLAPGGHAIVATFSGNTNYSASASSPLSETVQQTATTTALTTLINPTVFGQTATFTATVSSATGTPTGQVIFLDNGAMLGNATLNPAGLATLATGKLNVGMHSITAMYVSDGYYTASTSAAVQQVVNQAANTTALVSSANPATLGAPVTFTATITSSTSVSGTVVFMDGSSLLGSVNVSNGVATLTTGTLPFGPHAITAVYSGDASHATSTSTPLAQLIVQPATLTLTSSLNPAAAGNAVTFTARALPGNGILPTGSLIFRDGTATLATVALDATGTAVFTTSSLAVGPHTITAAYAGDTDFAAGTATLLETIQNSSVQIALTASANPATFGTPVTFTAAITTNGAIATGLVTFVDGTTTLGTGTLDATGAAIFTTRALTPGTHSISAVYAGDGKAGAGSSTALSVTVAQATTLTLASSANPSPTLASITLTASLSTTGTGTITFMDGNVQLGTAPLTAGSATLTLPQLSAGTHTLTATYAGDPTNFPSAAAPLTETVNLRPTTTTLSATASDPKNPQQVLLIGVVHASGSTPPTGTITFADGSTTLGSAAIDATGVATLSVTLSSGASTVIATYAGDAFFAGSVSAATPVKVGQPTQFSLALTPPVMTLVSNQHGTATLNIASVSGFADTLEFGCLGLPFAATCTFSAPSKALTANGSMSVSVLIDTGNPLGAGASASLAPPVFGSTTRNLLTLAFLPAAAFLFLRRRRALPLLVVLFGMVLTLSTTGCGGLTIHGTPAGTYSFKITAAGKGSGATQSQTMTLTVTQ